MARLRRGSPRRVFSRAERPPWPCRHVGSYLWESARHQSARGINLTIRHPATSQSRGLLPGRAWVISDSAITRFSIYKLAPVQLSPDLLSETAGCRRHGALRSQHWGTLPPSDPRWVIWTRLLGRAAERPCFPRTDSTEPANANFVPRFRF